jgi:predicted PurR-regulated permease PerM
VSKVEADTRVQAAGPPQPPGWPTRFQRRLMVVALSLLILYLAIRLLREFATILQPLLVAVLIGYVIFPVHRWMVRKGAPSAVAYVMIVLLFLGTFLGLAGAVRNSLAGLDPRTLQRYEARLNVLVNDTLIKLHLTTPGDERWQVRQLFDFQGDVGRQVADLARAVLTTFMGSFTSGLVVVLYLIFLLAEQATFPERMEAAFGRAYADHILTVVGKINEAIAQYIAVKTWISFLTAALSLGVLAAFGIEFALVWAVLIFFFNYIPYIGSWGAMAVPVLLSFVQYDAPWAGLAVAALLVGVQVVTGSWIEPRLAGRRLNLSPLGIVLALSFWGALWGVVGMILAVPLTVSLKIVLDNIDETKPIATLMSNL